MEIYSPPLFQTNTYGYLMVTFNNTSVYINTKSARNGRIASIHRVPVPQVNENFYFNQESIKAIVYYYTNNSTTLCFKESSTASIHLTNKRLILLSQSTSIASANQNQFDTSEFQLSDFQSLKSKLMHKRGLRFDIVTIRNEKIRTDVTFSNNKDANRRDSLKEYIKMATSAILSNRARYFQQSQQQQQQQVLVQDELPSYLEVTRTASFSGSINAPPAYC